jgi:hypothetical protein
LKEDIACAVVLALLFASASAVGAAPRSVQLDALLDGVSFSAQAQFRVAAILVGKSSAKSLFEDIPWSELSRLEYTKYRERDVRLRIRNREALAALQRLLLDNRASGVTVLLVDDQKLYAKWPGMGDEQRYRKEILIGVQVPGRRCIEMNRIVYQAINTAITTRLDPVEGQTERHINLNELFDVLLRERINEFMRTLDPVSKNAPACIRTFQLWKWLNAEEAPGFVSGEYRLHAGLKTLLDPVVDTLNNVPSQWSRTRLQLRVAGYTDAEAVDAIDLSTKETGVGDWSKTHNRLDIWYRGCSGNLLSGNTLQYLRFGEQSGTRVPQKIRNNCQLGAARAYVATVYVMNKLQWTDVEYSYATGGERTPITSDEKRDSPRRRAVEIEMVVKAARQQ